MPVKALQKFCENIPGILVEVNLKELIKQEFSKTGDRPKIVVDGSSLPYVFNSKHASHASRQPAAAKLRIESFFEEIISNGANVIVVLRGNEIKNPDIWFVKNKKSLAFERMKCETCNESEKFFSKFVNLASNFCCNETLASISNEHYRVFTSVKGTTNEVAKTAIKEKCLAVLGQDSDYLIYEGIRFYILLETLDIETFNCKFYDRDELLKCLGLKTIQLPMFATLCGNGIVCYSTLQSFQRRISTGKFATLLYVAEKVKYTPSDPYRCIEEIVKLIAHKGFTKKVMKESLDMYLKFEEIQPVDELLKFALERVRKCDWHFKLYTIFAHKEYFCKLLTGFCNNLTTFEFLRPLRKNLYGILFPSDDVHVKEYFLEEMLLRNSNRAVPKMCVCTKSNLENPGVIELFRNRTPRMEIVRWELFLSCVSKTIRFFDVRTVPDSCVFPVMALHYLYITVPAYFQEKKVFKEGFEVEVFLLGALLLKEFPKERLENIEQVKPDVWELQLNILYLDVCFTLLLLNEACGFVISKEKACICNFYNEKLIHWIYNKMKKGATRDEFFENNLVLESLFDVLMGVINKTD